MNRIRAAIIGTGAVAHLHAEAIATHRRAELIAVADPDSQRRSDFAEMWGVGNHYATIDELLAEHAIDVVHLCTPPSVHLAQTLTSYAAGAHVICEKPPALSLAELTQIQDAARGHDKYYAIVYQQRTGAAAAHVKALFDSGQLGRPLHGQALTLWYRGTDYYDVDWRGTWAGEGGGTTLGHGAHQLDLLAYLLGDWQEVSGHTWRLDRDVEFEDLSTATIRFDCGLIATATSTVLAPRQTSQVRIDTEHATVEVEHLYGHGRQDWRITPAPHIDDDVARSWQIPATATEPSGHIPVVHATYDALLAGEPLPELVAHPHRGLELITAIYASATYGRAITRAELLQDQRFTTALRAGVRDLRL